MKPLKIEMSAFGSYAGVEVVDFERIDHGIFLITGDTGSGKTTIFDALTFALFGEASGGWREGSMMRSHYASDDIDTYVALEFQENGLTYKIHRSPAYDRISKRKNKDGQYTKVNTGAKVKLFLPDGKEYPGNIKDINQKIQELIGVDRNQFTQIAMIAQGEYMKLLNASSKERKAIFAKIFQTGLYGRMQLKLKDRYNSLYGQLEDKRKLAEHELKNVQIAENHEYAKLWEELLSYKETKKEELLGALKQIIQLSKEDEAAIKTCLDKIQKELSDIQSKKEQADHINDLFRKKEQTDKDLQELYSQKTGIDEKKERLDAAHRAEKVVPYQKAWKDAVLEYMATELSVNNLKRSVAEKESAAGLAKIKYVEKQKEKDERLPALEQDIVKLSSALELYEEYQAVLDDKTKKIAVYNKNALKAVSLVFWKRANVEGQKKSYAQKEAEVSSVLTSFDKADMEYNRRYHLFIRVQAGILAKDLEEDMPCPVCGSIHHPKKAELVEAEVSQEWVEDARKERNKLEQRRDVLTRELLEMKAALTADTQYLETLELKWKRELGKVTEKTKLLKVTISDTEVRQILSSLETEQDELTKEIIALCTRGDAMKEQLTYESEQAAKQALELLNKQKAQLIAQEEESKAAWDKMIQEVQRLKGQLVSEESNLEIRNKAVTEKVQSYKRILSECGFETEEAYSQSILKEVDIKLMQKQVDEYLKQVIEKETKQSQLNDLVKDKKPIDVTEYTEQILKKQHKQQNLRQQELALSSERKVNETVYSNLKAIWSSQKDLESSYQVISRLYRTANGKLTGTAGVDFQTYVQRQYFMQMIQAANRRLKVMTDSQFLLQCRDMEALGKQGEVGLDLDVYSVATGKTRDVKTLSGGESFMAALAMALGMADIIQNTAGSIQMDALFIDEGFGSLDDESRMRAISILQELAGNKRMIGIVSHVTELKEQIERKLIVKKTDQGSKIHWAE